MTPAISKASTNAPGVLLVLNDVAEAAEEEFNRRYQQQHVPERLAVPGFRTARRCGAVDAQPPRCRPTADSVTGREGQSNG